MGWGKAEDVRALIQTEVKDRLREELYAFIDQRQQALRNLTPAQQTQLENLLTDLDAGAATTLAHQRATAKLIRMALRQ